MSRPASQPCGTRAAYVRHLRHREVPDEACIKANREEPAAVHWQHPDADAPVAVCHGRRTTASVTTDPAEVTCGLCKQSRTWKEAA